MKKKAVAATQPAGGPGQIDEQRQPLDPSALIPGLTLMPDFLSKNEEEEMLKELESRTWDEDLRRKVIQFGWKFNHQTHSLREYLGPIPAFVAPTCQRLVDLGLYDTLPDQVIVNHYAPGQGIIAHVDNIHCFAGTVGSVGLGSSCIMQFSHAETGRVVDVFFERRTAVILKGAARYEWKHAIIPNTADEYRGATYKRKARISVTWRNVILTDKLKKLEDKAKEREKTADSAPAATAPAGDAL